MRLQLLTTIVIPQMLMIEESAHITPWTADVFQRCFEARYSAWGVELAGNLVGFVIFSLQVGECHILNLCVDPQYQGQGYGRQLLLHVLDQAKQKNAQMVFLEVRRSNRVALSLYYKLDFTEIGVRKGYYPTAQGKEDAIMLARDLSG